MESYGNRMFNFVRKYRAVLPHSCPILHSHWQYMKVPVALTLSALGIVSFFFFYNFHHLNVSSISLWGKKNFF